MIRTITLCRQSNPLSTKPERKRLLSYSHTPWFFAFYDLGYSFLDAALQIEKSLSNASMTIINVIPMSGANIFEFQQPGIIGFAETPGHVSGGQSDFAIDQLMVPARATIRLIVPSSE